LLGGLSGFVTGGVSSLFSVGSFAGTVGVGALTGGLGGGIDAAFNGTNFLEGVLRGAAFGGTVAAVSYMISYFANPRTWELTKAEYDSYGIPESGEALDPSVDTLRKMFKETGWNEMNTGAKQFYADNPTGRYIRKGDFYYDTKKGEDVIAYTRRNFWDKDTSSINFSKGAFASKIKLGFVMTHELGHSTINLNPSLNMYLQVKTKSGYEPEMLPGIPGSDLKPISIEHGAIWGIERDFLLLNGKKDLPLFFNPQNATYFNSWFLPGQQYNRVYEYIKHLPVKIK